jgi:hypothetical protein
MFLPPLQLGLGLWQKRLIKALLQQTSSVVLECLQKLALQSGEVADALGPKPI